MEAPNLNRRPAEPPAPEHPNLKVRRLAAEIKQALCDPAFVGCANVAITPNYVAYDDADEDDPILAAIDAYRAGCEAFRGTPDDMTSEEEEAAIAATYGPPMEALEAWDKPALSFAGAAAALRLAADENMGVLGSDVSQSMVRAALGFLDPHHRPSSRI